MATKTKTYKELTQENIETLAGLAEQLGEFSLFKALCGRDITERHMFEILWGVYQEYADKDKTAVGTDKRSSLSSRCKQSYNRWKQVEKWADTDSTSKYANAWAQEKEILEWYLTESLVDIFTDLVKE